jgi:hypothetical protein
MTIASSGEQRLVPVGRAPAMHEVQVPIVEFMAWSRT